MKRARSGRGEAKQHQVLIINRPFISPQKSCDRCTAPSGLITPDEAAELCVVSQRSIYRLLEAGSIHFSETASGDLLICLSTLASTNIFPRVRHSTSNSRIKR